MELGSPLSRARDCALATGRSLHRGLQTGARTMTTIICLVIVGAVTESMLPLLIGKLAANVLARSDDGATRTVFFGVALMATLTISVFVEQSHVLLIERFSLKIGVHLRTHFAQLETCIPGIEHHERTDYVNRLSLLRNKSYALELWYRSFFQTAGLFLRLGIISVVIAASVPSSMALIPLLVLPMLVAAWRSGVTLRIERDVEEDRRRAGYAVELGSDPAYAKDVRILGMRTRVLADYRSAWLGWYKKHSRTRMVSILVELLCWSLCGTGLFVLLKSNPAAPGIGGVVMVALGSSQLAKFMGAAANEVTYLRRWTDAAASLFWLEELAKADGRPRAKLPAKRGAISFNNVSFRYPGTETYALRNVSFTLADGTIAAIVGVNGAGKSTILALLAKLFTPTSGDIAVFGCDLNDLSAEELRSTVTAAYQDFVRFEYRLSKSVGIGAPRYTEADNADADRGQLVDAVRQAGFSERAEQLPNGLHTQLGTVWPNGIDLSGGEWQKVALARAYMRPTARIVLLDEPSSAYDAETEQELFNGVIRRAKQARTTGGVTFLVTHRLSSVRNADLILVLDHGELVQQGAHEELMSVDGTYRDLYTAQAKGFG